MQCSSQGPTYLSKALSAISAIAATTTTPLSNRPKSPQIDEDSPTQEQINEYFSDKVQIDEPFSYEGVATVDDKVVYKLLERNPVQELVRTQHWFKVLDQGEVTGVQIDHQGELRFCMKMPYLGENLANLENSFASPKDIINQLIDKLVRMRKERGGNFYHGDIKPENIMFSKDGKLSLIDFSNCPLPEKSLDKFLSHVVTKSYLPARLISAISNKKQIILDPTVDELAFVRTVQEVLGYFDHETHLASFLHGFLHLVRRQLEYSEDEGDVKRTFELNRKTVMEAITLKFPYKMLTDDEREDWKTRKSDVNLDKHKFDSDKDKFGTVYSAVKWILQQKNWNEELQD